MVDQHPSFTWPKDEKIKIWRYLDFTKFSYLIFKKELFFPRAKLLGDPFEGSITKAQYLMRKEILENRFKDDRFKKWRNVDEKILRHNFKVMADANKSTPQMLCVSCWHMNTHESAAMWKLYTTNREAVCIQTTFETLVENLPNYVLAGVVKYLDYEKDMIPEFNYFNTMLHKRKSFEHEQEIRAIIWDTSQYEFPQQTILDKTILKEKPFLKHVNEFGVGVPIEPSIFIHKIFLSPTAPSWFFETVKVLVETLRFKIPIEQSSLSGKPVY